MLVGGAEWSPCCGQRQPEHAPSPRDQKQALLLDNQGKSKTERAEALAEKMLPRSGALLLKTREPPAGKIPLPKLARLVSRERHLDRYVAPCLGEAERSGDEPGEHPASALDSGHAPRRHRALEGMHLPDRLGKAVPGRAQQVLVERRGTRSGIVLAG